MSGCQRCLECGCLAVSDVLCADVWLSAMSCVRMSGWQRCLVCGCLAVIDVLCATGDCVLKQRSQPAAVSIPLFNFVTIAYILWPPIMALCVIQYVASKIDFSFFLNITSEGSCRNF